jgi:hypothetical protein
MTDDLDHMGPIDYIVVEFINHKVNGEALAHLVELVDRRIIRILDLRLVRKQPDGQIVGMAVEEYDDAEGHGLDIFVGAASGLLDVEDLAEVGKVLEPGSTAAILVYENVWAAPLARAVRLNGGQLVASGRIPVQAILAQLDAMEAALAEAEAEPIAKG